MQTAAVEILESIASPSTITREQGVRAANEYVAANVDSALKVVASNNDLDRSWETGRWRFFVCSEHAPLRAIHVDTKTGQVAPFTPDEIRIIREHAAIAAAKSQGILPLNEEGYVLSEYARRRANRYLGDRIGMFFNAADPVLISGEPLLWQVTIVFKQYASGPFTLGVMDVNAYTGEPIPLTDEQTEKLRVRTRAIIRRQTPTTTKS